jgi:transcriptional regulator with XRE-family HTH domain
VSTRLGSAIRQHRTATGVFAMDFAGALGVSESTLARWEGGSEPSLAQINDIESLLKLRRGELLIEAGFVDPPDKESSQAQA